jgi:hypothetical protein
MNNLLVFPLLLQKKNWIRVICLESLTKDQSSQPIFLDEKLLLVNGYQDLIG